MTIHTTSLRPPDVEEDVQIPLGFLMEMTNATSEDALSELFVRWAIRMTNAERCAVAIQDSDTTFVVHQSGDTGRASAGRSHPIAGSLMGDVLFSREMRIVRHLEQQRYAGCRVLGAAGMGTIVAVPVIGDKLCLGVISATYRKARVVSPRDRAIFEVLASVLGAQVILLRQMTDLKRLVRTDPLTGAFNRNHLAHTAAQHWNDWMAIARPFCIASVDLDHFKLVNDSMGHAIGDAVLRETVRRLKSKLRSGDTIIRMGGEEFCILLGGMSDSAASPFVRRLRNVIQDTPFQTNDGLVAVTASIGIASPDYEDSSFDETLRRSDKALYAAKAAGRNTVVTHVRQDVMAAG
ncbi:diguanylate cyclase (GGDEF) domain-containing protein [Cognatiyoonia koreensis]|uniref:diguanylate cyclase n=1 Tax=Cognatiyoonia koreensis TaxID=364200 RepID=A0A1I0RX50_9RHOB|nr:sensor domain-containing diguanylate cyclase [Cognatiyoonia koreensis]SEW46135.1 diguanylate cyclase (GGDEF) domain-containing protein [Cognatiyoonia koreensis]